MSNWQEYFTNVSGKRFSPAAVKVMVGRVLRKASIREAAVIRRFLNDGEELSPQDAARLRPLFEREAQAMIKQRSTV